MYGIVQKHPTTKAVRNQVLVLHIWKACRMVDARKRIQKMTAAATDVAYR
jgi:hypothetical protein